MVKIDDPPPAEGRVFKPKVEGEWAQETGGTLNWLEATHDTTLTHEQSLV